MAHRRGTRYAVSLLVAPEALAARATAVQGSLAPLVASLRSDIDPLLAVGTEIPAEKALLSRDGGRCPRDGTTLIFDPHEGRRHRCPECGGEYTGDRHYRAWVTWRQLWLAERAVHAATLHALTGEVALARLSSDILAGYAERYLTYPNRDNVLGPTRPFFSTYLESIWLLQLCIALDLLEMSGAPDVPGALVRDRVIEPSVALIGSFDERASNRQVWNDAALIAGSMLLADEAGARRAVTGASGVIAHLDAGLLADGSWYEGENYHLFAHRGLWYGVALAERAGIDLPPDLVARFQEGFATPLATTLPDFTFPSRRDSQYGVSLRQWRFAESCELGLARSDDPRLAGALWELYSRALPSRDTGRWRSTGEAERNELPTALSRADLGWRSLLFARPDLPRLKPAAPSSALLAEQGIAVFRREAGRVYVALDYGHSGGGHGHPDRLNLLIAEGDSRILDDMGTGSYVDPSLHWYRSTLAHNAPLIDGHSQGRANGVLLAYEERGGAAWVDAEVPEGGIAPNVSVSRAVIVMPDYVVDQLVWHSLRRVSCDLPIHAGAQVEGIGAWRESTPAGGPAPADGFPFLRETAVAVAERDAVAHLVLDSPSRAAAWVLASDEAEWWRAIAPGAPGHGDRPFVFVRVRAAAGSLTTVWSLDGRVSEVAERDGVLAVTLTGGDRHEHSRRERAWHIDLLAAAARSSIDLAGARTAIRREIPAPPILALISTPVPRFAVAAQARPLLFQLGAREFRRSEEAWKEAGGPTAEVTLAAVGLRLEIGVHVRKRPTCFRPAGAPDPAFDNEPPDIHSDGVQLYLLAPGWSSPAAWLAVPEVDGGRVRIRPVDGSHAGCSISAAWQRSPDGYGMRFSVPLSALGAGPSYPFAFDVIVNDMAPGRERRRGQLVLSGGAGEFVYLQGDRQSPARLLHFVVPEA
ncbi:MAG: heparinase II/III-family protein [Gemmatimonadota bacterium]|nr:heparinase II/III-family protein [Gemmatimonadota bacterium]